MNGTEDIRLQSHIRFLHTLKEDTLLVIDNFNVTEEQDGMLQELLEFSCKVLITTRYRFDEHTQLELKEISDIDAQMQLYRYFYAKTNEDADNVKQIIETVHGHTLAMELSARLLKFGILTSEQLLDKLK